MPWETKLLREDGYLPQRQRARSASRSRRKSEDEELEGGDVRNDDAFRVALADALALARQPRHIIVRGLLAAMKPEHENFYSQALSRVYAQALEDGRTSRVSTKALRHRGTKASLGRSS